MELHQARYLPRRRVRAHVELRLAQRYKLFDLLLEGKINAAMVGDVQDIPARIDDWLLFVERYVAVLAPTHRLANRPSIGIDDLRETVLLERAGCDVGPKILRSYFPEAPPHRRHCSGHDLHLQHMAAAARRQQSGKRIERNMPGNCNYKLVPGK